MEMRPDAPVNVLVDSPLAGRSLRRSLVRGWRRRCPGCGASPLFQGFVRVRRTCAACGERLHHQRADDLPAYLTILIAGKTLIFGLVTIEMLWSPPVWVHWAIWPAATVLLSLWLLPRIKGAAIGMQWALGMHGFGGVEDD